MYGATPVSNDIDQLRERLRRVESDVAMLVTLVTHLAQANPATGAPADPSAAATSGPGEIIVPIQATASAAEQPIHPAMLPENAQLGIPAKPKRRPAASAWTAPGPPTETDRVELPEPGDPAKPAATGSKPTAQASSAPSTAHEPAATPHAPKRTTQQPEPLTVAPPHVPASKAPAALERQSPQPDAPVAEAAPAASAQRGTEPEHRPAPNETAPSDLTAPSKQATADLQPVGENATAPTPWAPTRRTPQATATPSTTPASSKAPSPVALNGTDQRAIPAKATPTDQSAVTAEPATAAPATSETAAAPTESLPPLRLLDHTSTEIPAATVPDEATNAPNQIVDSKQDAAPLSHSDSQITPTLAAQPLRDATPALHFEVSLVATPMTMSELTAYGALHQEVWRCRNTLSENGLNEETFARQWVAANRAARSADDLALKAAAQEFVTAVMKRRQFIMDSASKQAAAQSVLNAVQELAPTYLFRSGQHQPATDGLEPADVRAHASRRLITLTCASHVDSKRLPEALRAFGPDVRHTVVVLYTPHTAEDPHGEEFCQAIGHWLSGAERNLQAHVSNLLELRRFIGQSS